MNHDDDGDDDLMRVKAFPSPCGVVVMNPEDAPTVAHTLQAEFPSPCGVVVMNLEAVVATGMELESEFPSPCGVVVMNHLSRDRAIQRITWKVSVPLRGSGDESRFSLCRLRWLWRNRVSVPLRGSGDESVRTQSITMLMFPAMVSVPLRGSGDESPAL